MKKKIKKKIKNLRNKKIFTKDLEKVNYSHNRFVNTFVFDESVCE